jgi:hypothetical protein
VVLRGHVITLAERSLPLSLYVVTCLYLLLMLLALCVYVQGAWALDPGPHLAVVGASDPWTLVRDRGHPRTYWPKYIYIYNTPVTRRVLRRPLVHLLTHAHTHPRTHTPSVPHSWIKAGVRDNGDALEAVTSSILGQDVMHAARRDPPFSSGALHEPFPPAVGGDPAAPFRVPSRGPSAEGRRSTLGCVAMASWV